jgi:hypothetical protein
MGGNHFKFHWMSGFEQQGRRRRKIGHSSIELLGRDDGGERTHAWMCAKMGE